VICLQMLFVLCWKKCLSQLLNVHKLTNSVLNKEELSWDWEKCIVVSIYKTVGPYAFHTLLHGSYTPAWE
jgi:hypothetical protein